MACYNCIGVCPHDGIKYSTAAAPRENRETIATDAAIGRGLRTMGDGSGAPVDPTRRQALRNVVLAATGVMLAPAAVLPTTRHPAKTRPITPPGSQNVERFTTRCTACQLCVGVCPTQVLQPALFAYGLTGIAQPQMIYDEGSCVYDCNLCGQICPTSAILQVAVADKQRLQVGVARFVRDDCVVSTKHTACGACSEHCPTKAVNMVPFEGTLRIPQIDEELCIGCGACEHPCPTRPNKAIFVEARATHGLARKPVPKQLVNPLPGDRDFPF